MNTLQVIARMFFVSFTISMLILQMNPKAIWAFPFGLLIALFSEAEYMSGKYNKIKQKPKEKSDERES